MWLTDLSAAAARQVFGPEGARIVHLSRRAVAGEPPVPPADRALYLCEPHPDSLPYRTRRWRVIAMEEALERFGPNGMAVAIWLETWSQMPWLNPRGNARPTAPGPTIGGRGRPYPDPVFARYNEVYRAMALRLQEDNSMLHQIWHKALLYTELIGDEDTGIFAYMTTVELAEPERDQHFLLEMMPWVWAGYWPIGWVGDPPVMVVND